MIRLILVTAIALVASSSSSSAQDLAQCGSYDRLVTALLMAPAAQADAAARNVADVGQNAYCFAWFAAGPQRPDNQVFQLFVKAFESSRSDKQVSAGATNGTSVVSQGPAAKVLSAAVEYGGLTRAVDGHLITLRGNAAGLPSALVRKNIFPYCASGVRSSEFCVAGSALSILRRISFSVSFDAARGTQVVGTPATSAPPAPAQTVTFTAQRNQISAASTRIELWNHRDVTSKQFQDQWRAKVGSVMSQPAADLLEAAGPFAEQLKVLPGYNEWETRTKDALLRARPDRGRIFAELDTAIEQLMMMARAEQSDIDRLAAAALAAYSRYFLAQDDLIAALATKNVLAFEYTGNRPAGQTGTSNLRLILDVPLTTRTKIVANGAATLYDSLPADVPSTVSRYRDAQIGVQVDHGLGPQSIVGPAVITVAAYYQYQHSPALLKVDPLKPIPGIAFLGLPATAKTVLASSGHIWLGQAKLSLAPSGSSVNVPLSVTYSNRTELIDKPTWRGQVGIAYDLDSLLGALNR